ncbi:MAG: PIN domain-containing protein [Methanoregula sp.]
MTQIFIDTQIFLNLYKTKQNVKKILEDIEKIKSYLVFPEQVLDEFVRNRDNKIRELKKNIVDTQNICSFGLFNKYPEFNDCKELRTQIDDVKKRMLAKCDEILTEPDKDEIFSYLLKLYSDNEVLSIKRTSDIFKRAHQRKLIGNPPITERKNSIGDEINWESILDRVKDDLVIISDDHTYESDITFLSREFQQTVNRKILAIDNKLTTALKFIDVKPSKELKLFETEQEQKIVDETVQKIIQFRELVKPSSDWTTDSSGNYYLPNTIMRQGSIFSFFAPSTNEKVYKKILNKPESSHDSKKD